MSTTARKACSLALASPGRQPMQCHSTPSCWEAGWVSMLLLEWLRGVTTRLTHFLLLGSLNLIPLASAAAFEAEEEAAGAYAVSAAIGIAVRDLSSVRLTPTQLAGEEQPIIFVNLWPPENPRFLLSQLRIAQNRE